VKGEKREGARAVIHTCTVDTLSWTSWWFSVLVSREKSGWLRFVSLHLEDNERISSGEPSQEPSSDGGAYFAY